MHWGSRVDPVGGSNSDDKWLTYAEQHGQWTAPREGKRVALFSITEQHSRNGKS